MKTMPRAQLSFCSSLLSAHGHWQRNAPQTLRARCVVSGGVVVVGYGELLAGWTMLTHVLVGTSYEPERNVSLEKYYSSTDNNLLYKAIGKLVNCLFGF